MKSDAFDRRRFLAAMIAVSGAAIALPSIASRAWASGADSSDPETSAALLRLDRCLFPHAGLPDAAYAAVLEQALADVASSVALDDVIAALEARSGVDWLSMDDTALLAALRSVEAEPAFLAVVNQVRAGLYNGADYWAYVGYPGPSKDFGGYLYHGAGEIDWLAGES